MQLAAALLLDVHWWQGTGRKNKSPSAGGQFQ